MRVACMDCGREYEAGAGACPACGSSSSTTSQAAGPARATVKRTHEMAGTGCVVQGLGLLAAAVLLLFGPLGWILAAAVAFAGLLLGSAMSAKLTCSACRNPVASRGVKMCPTCRAEMD